MFNLSEQGRRKGILFVLFLSVAVLIGQISDAGGFSLDNMPDALRLIIDQTQYLVGLMAISLLMIIAAVKKYVAVPNDLFRAIIWYFTLLFLSDFITLLIRMIQKSNIISLQNGFSGIGAFYLILASIRSVTELVLTSVAAGILIWGLVKYRFVQQEPPAAFKRLGPTVIGLILFKIVAAIPVSLVGIVTNRSLFIWSLVLSQLAQLAIAFLFYWVVKEHQQQFKTKFFTYMTRYFGINFLITGLSFVYTMGSYTLLQRSPVGELETLGGFGKVVFFASLCAQVILNYYMYQAITGYEEDTETPETPDIYETTPSPTEAVVLAGVDQLQSAVEQSAASED